jgi:protein-S-isoprenylcysteine O-methyltransferase Ste14
MKAPTGMTDHLGVTEGATLSPRARKRWHLAGHWALSVILALLWGQFAANAYRRWALTGSLVLLGLVFFNTLLVGVTVSRRPSMSTSTQVRDWVAAVLTVGISFLFRPGESPHPLAQAAGSILQGVGLLIMLVALTHLGRSFGIVAANRGIKRSGLYAWVRHPLYAGELIFFPGFLLANFSPFNLVLWSGIVWGLVIRSRVEERHLGQDPEYRAYMEVVPYRFFPGLF